MSPTERPSSTELTDALADEVKERFVRYARIDTQSKLGVDEVPSTEKQLDLSRLLVTELEGLGAADVEIDDHGIVFATIPATVTEDVPVFGVLAHVDTSSDAPGAGVKPQIVRYDGGTLALPGDETVTLDPKDSPELAEHVGHEIVTSDGTTLLGADDKAGVAAIMTATSYLLSHTEIPRGKVRVAFTTDEEVGHGAKFFDIQRFGATCAYTIDGSKLGSIEDETFSAASVDVRFRGFGIHAGYAKDRMVNSMRLAAAFLDRLPTDQAPETTEGRDGFVHPVEVHGTMEETHIHLIVRDFNSKVLEERINSLRDLAQQVTDGNDRAHVEFETESQYRNMRENLEEVPHVVEAAIEAIRRAGVEPVRGYIRGGTDGSMLTAMGLPTPNLFCGAHDFHSVKEWVCVRDMAAAAATIVNLAQVWAERR